jgi:hypothetical protein
MRSARLAIALIAVGAVLFTSAGVGFAEEKTFTLAPRESVNVGGYTATYLGLTASGWPAYGLYAGGGTVAKLPSNPPPPACCNYQYQNVSITTTNIAPGGGTVTGVMTVR